MFLAVLIIAVALRAEPELQIGTVHLCPAADCAFMLGDARVSPYIPLKLMSSVDLLRIQMHHIPGGYEKV